MKKRMTIIILMILTVTFFAQSTVDSYLKYPRIVGDLGIRFELGFGAPGGDLKTENKGGFSWRVGAEFALNSYLATTFQVGNQDFALSIDEDYIDPEGNPIPPDHTVRGDANALPILLGTRLYFQKKGKRQIFAGFNFGFQRISSKVEEDDENGDLFRTISDRSETQFSYGPEAGFRYNLLEATFSYHSFSAGNYWALNFGLFIPLTGW